MNTTIVAVIAAAAIRASRKEQYPIVVRNSQRVGDRSFPQFPTWEARFAHRGKEGGKQMSMNVFILGDVSSLLGDEEE